MIGYALTLVLLFPIFWMIGGAANPELARAGAARAGGRRRAATAPTIRSPRKQADECGQLLDYLSKKGVAYTKAHDARGRVVTIGGEPVADTSPAGLDAALTRGGLQSRQGACRPPGGIVADPARDAGA